MDKTELAADLAYISRYADDLRQRVNKGEQVGTNSERHIKESIIAIRNAYIQFPHS
jgi:predicted DNA-binding protein (UPF0278 family)